VEKRVVTVLRSGGEYEPKHVLAMQRQVAQWAPDAMYECLSDIDIPGVKCTPLRHSWPGWWAKLELFRPDIEGGYLYTDLDNVIVGPIDDMFRTRYTTQATGWNALMYVPRDDHEFALNARRAYREFKLDQDRGALETFRQKFKSAEPFVPFGDAGFMNQYVSGEAWEEVLPGQVVNIVQLITRWPFTHQQADPLTYPYKRPPPGTRVVLCANKIRRPWKLKLFQHLYDEGEV